MIITPDKKLIDLPNVTIVCIDCKNYGQSVFALIKCLEQVKPYKAVLITDAEIKNDNIEVVKIDRINSKYEYSSFVVKELYKYFETDFVLIIQHDGFILNGSSWDDEFLNYDYIGATWLYPDNRNVGNGGFSLRSKRLQEIIATDEEINITHPEDEVICRLYRGLLYKCYNIKFAPENVANKFSFELNAPVQKTFGFHGYFHPPFKEHIILKRTSSLGDVIMLTPVMEYFHNKGYQIVLDTLPQFMGLFFQHYFPVLHISHMNENIKPIREINFDMAYEMTPKQPVLKSYYDVAGIKDEPLINSRLNIYRGGEERFFEKYAVIHIDQTGIPHREINDVDWHTVVKYLERKGYTVFQIGKREHEKVATYFNTMTIELLMYFIKHSSLFIGTDSGNAQIAVAFNVPSVIFFGSVNPKFRYNNFDRIRVVQNECDRAGCYHEVIGVAGQDCFYNKTFPPCCSFDEEQVIEKINELI